MKISIKMPRIMAANFTHDTLEEQIKKANELYGNLYVWNFY